LTLAERAAPVAGTSPPPPFRPEHEAFRAELREFVAAELRPHAPRWEAERWFPDEVFAKLAARGYLGLKYPADYGGRGGGHVLDAVLCEELPRAGSGGLAAAIGAHTGIATPPVWTFGTEDQKRRFLAPAIAGERIAALAITEPGAGSDVAGIRTRARRVDGGYVVSGSKTFITNGVRADFVVTAVKTTDQGGHRGLSFLLVERSMEGFGASRKLEKLGWHASDTAELHFDDVFVPEHNLLGEENRGFYLVMANFQWERLLMALGAVGSMAACVERVAERAAGRARQRARHQLAEMATLLEAGRAVTYNALRLFVDGEDAVREVTIAKLATQRACYEVAETALEIIAALPGSTNDELVELDRAARDARLGPIGGGTDEIMREVLGRRLGL